MSYDSTTKRVYINTATDPDTGISIADLKAALAENSNDLGTLCRSGNINKWAKYKPFRSNMLAPTEAQRQDKNYGLFIPYYTSIQDMADDMDGGVWTNAYPRNSGRTPWGYETPRGIAGTTLNPTISNEWFRMLDFDEYRGLAEAFVEPCSSTAWIPVGSAQDVAFSFPYHYSQYALAPSNIYPNSLNNGGADTLTPLYLGICIRASGASRYSWTLGLASTYDSSSISRIYASIANLGANSYTVFLFLSSVAKTVSDPEQTAVYVPIPMSVSAVTVRMEKWELRNLAVTASQDRTRYITVNWSVDLENNASPSTVALTCTAYDIYGATIGTYSGSPSLSHGTNTGTFSINASGIGEKLSLTILITDSVHGNESAVLNDVTITQN